MLMIYMCGVNYWHFNARAHSVCNRLSPPPLPPILKTAQLAFMKQYMILTQHSCMTKTYYSLLQGFDELVHIFQ